MGNSGAFSSYLAIIMVLMLVFISSINKFRLKYFYIAIIFVTVVIILFTQGRASWVAISITSLFIAFNVLKTEAKALTGLYKKYRLAIIGVSLCFILISSFFIFNLKKDSSNGRVLIWKITTEMIKETPFLGVGFGNFGSIYPLHQANYLKVNKVEPMRFLANDISHPFNEYLFTTAEVGVVGFVMFVAIFVAVLYFKPPKNRTILACYSGIFCFLILSLFTYPFKIFSIQFLVFSFIVIISSEIKNKPLLVFKKNTLSMIFIGAVISSFLIFQMEFNRFQLERKWNKTNEITKDLTWEARHEALSSIYEKEDIRNWSILMNYGVELVYQKKYHKAIEVFLKSSNFFKTSDLYLNLGVAFENTDQPNEAEQAYLTAANIVPHKFLPNYRLVLLYDRMDRKSEAKSLAKTILQTPAKINSSTVLDIKYEMRKYLKND
ncbi:O-antigen ligase family protein [Hyunsoonleella pacifica]|nr:O-antigen ligase family protein [Hyunsoonleella pacifica]